MSSPKIMVVEDKAIIALDIMRFLVSRGYKNTTYYLNGIDALKAIKNNKPDLALLDVILADDISGIDIAKELKRLSVPFIFISALSNPNHQKAVMKLSPEAIFLKPVNLNEVLIAIQNIFTKTKTGGNRPSSLLN
jgi:DNA-binding response OmpR family regulator